LDNWSPRAATPLKEKLIGADPDWSSRNRQGRRSVFTPQAKEDYMRATALCHHETIQRDCED